MFKKIILATDLSPAWDEIVACATEFKILGATELILTHVITVKFMGGMEASLRAEAEPKLAAQKESLERQGFDVSVELPQGLPAYSLNEVAQRYGANLIVLGSHGKSLWREAVLGCFTCAVLHQTRYPTLVLNVQISKEGEAGTCRLNCAELFRHILYPTDFSTISEQAGGLLTLLAPRGVSQVTVLHALDLPETETFPPGYREKAEAQARAALQDAVAKLQQAGVPQVESIFAPGRPIPAILQVLQGQDISLIVLGTQGKGFLKEIFLGSVAHNVARLAPCPVLLIPPATR